MARQLVLSDAELDLILELLESQQRELLVEIRHTDHGDFRNSLRERLASVEALINSVRSARAAS